MKKIKPMLSRMANQFVFEYDGVEYDIVDLCKDEYGKDVEFRKFYKPYNFELYDGNNVVRFKSIEEAIKAVRNGTYKEQSND
jgi:hypothetical protein